MSSGKSRKPVVTVERVAWAMLAISLGMLAVPAFAQSEESADPQIASAIGD